MLAKSSINKLAVFAIGALLTLLLIFLVNDNFTVYAVEKEESFLDTKVFSKATIDEDNINV